MRRFRLASARRRFFGLLSVLIPAVHLCVTQSATPATSGEVHLALSCPVSPCRFRQGEVVPIDLVFSADVPGYVVFDSYAGRFDFTMRLDRLTIGPWWAEGDPLGSYERKMMNVFGSYNLNAQRLFERSAVKVRLELNQWFLFDKPGTYTVGASSLRVSKVLEMTGSPNWDPTNPVKLQSEPIEIEIVAAEPEWQRREFERIISALPATLVSNTVAKRAAVRALSYLGTDDARQEIRKRLNTSDGHMDRDWQFAQLVSLARDSARLAQ